MCVPGSVNYNLILCDDIMGRVEEGVGVGGWGGGGWRL